jgi:hypothetical protein
MEWLLNPGVAGRVAGFIAQTRDLSFMTWWLYGATLFPATIMDVFFATPNSVTIAQRTGATA